MKNYTLSDWKSVAWHGFLYFICVGLGTVASILIFHSPNMIYAPAAVALISGWVYFHLIEKTPKFGAITLVGLVISLFFLLSRHYILAVFPNVIFALLADLLAYSSHYQSKLKNTISYLIFSLGNLAPIIGMWLSRKGYIAYLLGKGKDMAYVNRVMVDSQPSTIIYLLATVLVTGLLGAWIGQKLLKKS